MVSSDRAAMHHYLTESRRWETAVLLTVPLLVFYQAGLLLFTDGTVRNAADVLLVERVLRLSGARGAILVNALALGVFLVAAWRRGRRPSPGLLPLVMVESAGWALLLPFAGHLVAALRVLSAPPMAGASTLGDAALRVGAGLWEEILFRLILVSGLYTAAVRVLRVDPIWAATLAVVVGGLLFSAFHHWGPGAEAFRADVFTFRFLAGVALGLLFVYRGLAVVCWTHALYNLQLLWV